MYGNCKGLNCKTMGRRLRLALLGACAILIGGVGAAHAASPTVYARLIPISDAELAEMRGGFVLPNGMIVAIQMMFHTLVTDSSGATLAEDFESLDEGDLSGAGGTGVVHSVVVVPDSMDEAPPIVMIDTDITDEISGVMNMIQNNANLVAIQNMTTVNVELMNTGISLQTFQANNFGFRMRSLGALGLGL